MYIQVGDTEYAPLTEREIQRSKFCISVWMLLYHVMLEGAYSGWTLYFTHCSVAVGPRSKQEMDGRGCSFSFRFFFSMGGRDL